MIALDRRHLRVLGLDRQHQAAANGFAVEQDRAGAADAMLAAEMCAGEPQLVAQRVGQALARLDLKQLRPCR